MKFLPFTRARVSLTRFASLRFYGKFNLYFNIFFSKYLYFCAFSFWESCTVNMTNSYSWQTQHFLCFELSGIFPWAWNGHSANIYLFKVNNRNTRKRCEICLKLIKQTPAQPHLPLQLILLVTLNIFNTFL